jgi:hypothetical protein
MLELKFHCRPPLIRENCDEADLIWPRQGLIFKKWELHNVALPRQPCWGFDLCGSVLGCCYSDINADITEQEKMRADY